MSGLRLRALRRFLLLALAPLWLSAHAGTIVLESWRTDDRDLWESVLIPAFERKHPGISVRFAGTAPTQYDAALADRLAAGTAGDVVACRPFDVSLALYRKGYLERLNGLPGMEHFNARARLAWQTDDGRDVFCLPVASVLHGFFYNKRIFARLGLQVPETAEEFIAVLEAVRRTGTVPLALGTADRWEATQTLFTNVGPAWWGGEDGRRALATGKARFTDARFMAALAFESRLAPYLGHGVAGQGYADSRRQFADGQAAVYPAGSWDIAYFNKVPGLELGVFRPPVVHPGERCQVTDHMDIGVGLNRHARNREDGWKLLAWMATQEFADLYTNGAVGFFSLSTHLIAITDPLAKQMAGWRDRCGTSFRLNAQFLNRGAVPLEQVLWDVNAAVLNGNMSARTAAQRLQQNMDQWHRPPVR
ncbi:ABC transporter substrate-binding protein [Massilia putida]|uniref:ABC transporter substrate-binding protein n=1 Tax=Massilia putida TaxID=1141883 RepID=UPI000950E6B4|nr:extracellular solute-binding protein [Massilia putida]